MDRQDWLEAVALQLHSTGVGVREQQRLLAELRDHIDDLYCEERNHAMSIEALNGGLLEQRLGKPEEVAAAAAVHAPRDKFARRHPIVTFLLLPIPALVLLWTTYTLGLAGLLQLFREYKDADWAVSLIGILIHGLAYVPAVALILLIAWVAVRSRSRIAWWLAASVMVAVVSWLMMVSFSMPTTPGTGQLQVGMGFPPNIACWPQFAVPLLVALALLGYSLWQRRSEQLTSSL